MLTFEYEIELDQTFTQTCMGHEKNDTLVQYGLVDKRQKNDRVVQEYLNYGDIDWETFPAVMSPQAIKKLGIKSFPHIGGIGFYSLEYENRSVILAPIFIDESADRYIAPTLAWTTTDTEIDFTITDPQDVTFDCYRITVRREFFAEEYVVYDKSLVVPAPPTGEYQIGICAYIEDRLATSLREYENIAIVSSNEPYAPHITKFVQSINDIHPGTAGNVEVNAPDIPFVDASYIADNVKDAIVETNVITLEVVLSKDDWLLDSQTVVAAGVTATNLIQIIPVTNAAYMAAGITCTEQGIDTLTFTCTTEPTEDLTVLVVII